jgi:hypothetical protein
VSAHVCVPVEHEYVPAVQAFPSDSHTPPATHETQLPPLQTMSAAQLVPLGRGAAVSAQTSEPLPQVVLPYTQGLGFVSQAAPAVHGLHTPALHTRLSPQPVPFVSGTVVSTHVWPPVAQEYCQVVHEPNGVQSPPATHETHAPSLHTRFVPQVSPFAAMIVPVSTQAWMPVAQEVTPATQEFGFVSQASPAVQETHAPPLHTWFVPQVAPSGAITVAVSTQVSVPVVQEVVPATHWFGLVEQACPATQVEQTPPLHTWFVPQIVPSGSAAGLSTHTDVPVEQEVTPVRQGSGLVGQASPAVQETHAPASHTRFVPQLEPSERTTAVSMQSSTPVAQSVTPSRQALGFVPQGSPAEHAPHTPALHTRSVPQLVPLPSGTAVSTQVWTPVEQEVSYAVHAPAGVQSAPATHAPHAPEPLHTRSVPQLVPAALGVAESTHIWLPVAQEVTPSMHAPGFVSQASPAVQAPHAPALHTWFVPQLAPSARTVEVSTQSSTPVEQSVTPTRHAVGFVLQGSPAEHAPQTPPLQTMSVPQLVPFGTGSAVGSQVCVPLVQLVRLTVHAPAGVQSAPAVHALHAPEPSHT